MNSNQEDNRSSQLTTKASYSNLYYPGDNAEHLSRGTRSTSNNLKSDAKSTDSFDVMKIKNLHIALKQGTESAIEEWLKSTGLWTFELKRSIRGLVYAQKPRIMTDADGVGPTSGQDMSVVLPKHGWNT